MGLQAFGRTGTKGTCVSSAVVGGEGGKREGGKREVDRLLAALPSYLARRAARSVRGLKWNGGCVLRNLFLVVGLSPSVGLSLSPWENFSPCFHSLSLVWGVWGGVFPLGLVFSFFEKGCMRESLNE